MEVGKREYSQGIDVWSGMDFPPADSPVSRLGKAKSEVGVLCRLMTPLEPCSSQIPATGLCLPCNRDRSGGSGDWVRSAMQGKRSLGLGRGEKCHLTTMDTKPEGCIFSGGVLADYPTGVKSLRWSSRG